MAATAMDTVLNKTKWEHSHSLITKNVGQSLNINNLIELLFDSLGNILFNTTLCVYQLSSYILSMYFYYIRINYFKFSAWLKKTK